MTEFYNQFFCEQNERYSIIIEDDGKVAYAYLLDGGAIVADVWIYNQAPSPLITKWNRADMPFLNPRDYVQYEIEPITKENEVKLKWTISANSIDSVLIYIRGSIVSKLTIGATPGWSKCVSKDGPLAKML